MGYGDITPQTELGRAIIIISILFAVVLIPIESNELRDILLQRSIHDGSYRSSKSHVVISGHISATSLFDFLREFYHQVSTIFFFFLIFFFIYFFSIFFFILLIFFFISY